MYWNEKIDWLTKRYPTEEFSVPSAHLNRKALLRQVETKFLSRTGDYYELNNYTPRYSHWWDNIESTLDLTTESNPFIFLKSIIDPDKPFWLACEFNGGVMIYKSKLNAALDLIAAGYSWTDTYHIIQLKYDYLISVRLKEAGTSIKVAGSEEIEDKVKRATTPHYQ